MKALKEAVQVASKGNGSAKTAGMMAERLCRTEGRCAQPGRDDRGCGLFPRRAARLRAGMRDG